MSKACQNYIASVHILSVIYLSSCKHILANAHNVHKMIGALHCLHGLPWMPADCRVTLLSAVILVSTLITIHFLHAASETAQTSAVEWVNGDWM